jgi:hypothetical protein
MTASSDNIMNTWLPCVHCALLLHATAMVHNLSGAPCSTNCAAQKKSCHSSYAQSNEVKRRTPEVSPALARGLAVTWPGTQRSVRVTNRVLQH